MEALLIIGIALALATVLCCVVEEMAKSRGRRQGAWTIAGLIGLLFAFVGWLVVVAALLVLGPTQARKQAAQQHAAAPAR